MSTEQSSLGSDQWGREPEPEPEPEPAKSTTLPYREDRCQNCGGHTTDRFRRVLGDNDNIAWACPECHGHESLYRRAAAGKNQTRGGAL